VLAGKTDAEYTDDPWPIVVPGGDRPLSSNKIGEYVNGEFFHYYRFYLNTKHCGPPFAPGWTEWPAWVCQLIARFDSDVDLVRAHNEREAYRQAGVKYG